MARVKRQRLGNLSPEEAKVIGDAADYDWSDAEVLPARVRPSTVQFSLRVDSSLLDRLQGLAAASGATVSDIARSALERYVEAGGRPAVSNLVVSFPRDAGMLLRVEGTQAGVSPNRAGTDPGRRPLETSATY